MSDIKFECPACGQHLQCDRAFGGDVIHCPRCCAELRVPFGVSSQIDSSVLHAEMITPPAAPQPITRKTAAHPTAPTVDGSSHQPVEATCPVCQSVLRIASKTKAGADGYPGLAELVRKGSEPPAPASPAHEPAQPPAKPEPPAPKPAANIQEREQQIAAARQAHPIQLYPAVKPRMDYVLSGEAPPPASQPPKSEAKPGPPKHSEDSLTE